MPDLYNEHITDVNSCIMQLWEKGFLEIDFLKPVPSLVPEHDLRIVLYNLPDRLDPAGS